MLTKKNHCCTWHFHRCLCCIQSGFAHWKDHDWEFLWFKSILKMTRSNMHENIGFGAIWRIGTRCLLTWTACNRQADLFLDHDGATNKHAPDRQTSFWIRMDPIALFVDHKTCVNHFVLPRNMKCNQHVLCWTETKTSVVVAVVTDPCHGNVDGCCMNIVVDLLARVFYASRCHLRMEGLCLALLSLQLSSF